LERGGGEKTKGHSYPGKAKQAGKRAAIRWGKIDQCLYRIDKRYKGMETEHDDINSWGSRKKGKGASPEKSSI